MQSIDIQILTNEQDYMIYNEQCIYFRDITVQEYINISNDMIKIFSMDDKDYKQQEKAIDLITQRIFNIDTPLKGITVKHLILIKQHFVWLDYKHQGFTEEQYQTLSKQKTPPQKYTVDFMFLLHKMSNEKGWTHEYMMNMKKRVFYRYYGYMYQDTLREIEAQKEADKKQSKSDSMANLRKQAGQ